MCHLTNDVFSEAGAIWIVVGWGPGLGEGGS